MGTISEQQLPRDLTVYCTHSVLVWQLRVILAFKAHRRLRVLRRSRNWRKSLPPRLSRASCWPGTAPSRRTSGLIILCNASFFLVFVNDDPSVRVLRECGCISQKLRYRQSHRASSLVYRCPGRALRYNWPAKKEGLRDVTPMPQLWGIGDDVRRNTSTSTRL